MIDGGANIENRIKRQSSITLRPFGLANEFCSIFTRTPYQQQMEFEWILQKEVLIVLKQLHDILVECAHRFPVPLHGNEGKKVDKFVLTSGPEQLKVVVTLTGDAITHAVS